MSEATIIHGRRAGQFLSDRTEIARAFRVFRDHCLVVKLQIGTADADFSARILEVTATQFVLEDIRPRTSLPLLRAGTPFSLAARLDGIYGRADELRVVEIGEDRGVPYFVVPLPAQMLYHQRRRAPRFRLPLEGDAARITLHRAERALEGALVDISSGGCRAVFDVVNDPKLAPNEVVARCDINIPNLLVLDVATTIRYHSLSKQTGQLTCGLEFASMALPHRRRLERFIAKLARLSAPA